MKFIHKSILSLSLATATTATLSLSSRVQAATLNLPVTFNTTNQSLWAEGSAFNFSKTNSLAVSWNKSGRIAPVTLIPSVCLPLVGCSGTVKTPNVSGSTNGSLGFQNTFSLNGGSVNATIPINLSLLLPDSPVALGSNFNIGTGFSLAPSASFQTFSPALSEELDLIFDVAAKLDIAGIINSGFSINKNVSLLKLNNSNTSFSSNNRFGSLSANLPTVNTTGTVNPKLTNGLSSSGSDIFANGSLNITNIASSLLGLPPLSGSDSFGIGRVRVGYDYNLLTITATLKLAALQDFALQVNSLPASLSLLLDDGTSTAATSFKVGDTLSLIAPDKWSGKATATIDLNALFSNDTDLQFIPGFDISALEAGLSLPLGLGHPRVGPLFKTSQNFPTTPINLYRNQFALGGFSSQQVSFQIPVGSNAGGGNGGGGVSVPEPFSVPGLLALGALGIASKLRRRQGLHRGNSDVVRASRSRGLFGSHYV